MTVFNFTHSLMLSTLLLVLSTSRYLVRDFPLLVPALFLSLAPQHGMTFCFLPDRNPFWTPLSQTSRHFLAELLKVYKPTRQLHSSSDRLIQFPFFIFHCAHTLAWSEIFRMLLNVSGTVPCKVRSSNTLGSFKPSLKSHLFMLFY